MESDSQEQAYLPQNAKELSSMLGVSVYIFNKWVSEIASEIGPRVGKVFSSKQVAIIIKKYGCIESTKKIKKVK